MNGIWLLIAGGVWLGSLLVLRRRYGDRESAQRYDLDVLAVGILFTLTLGFFWRTLSGDVFQPADGGDLASFLFPTYRFAASQLAAGDLPLWNPTLYAGAPFVADIQAGFLYAPNLILFLLRPNFAYATLQWFSIGHLFWTGLGMYVLLRVIRWPQAEEPKRVAVTRPAAVFGAIAFQYSDPLLIHFGNLNLIAGLSWMPWVLAAYILAVDQRRRAWAGVAGIVFAAGAYAGHAQSTFYVALALIAYALLSAVTDEETAHVTQGMVNKARRLASVYLLPLFVVAIFAGLLMAPLLLPGIELTGYTDRSDLSYQETVAFSLAPTQLIGLLTPGFFGRGPALYWSLWERVELPYAGVAAFLMALAAVFLAPASTRRRLWPWLGLGLLGLFAGLGIYAIVHGWLTMVLPMFDSFRAPARAVVLWTFAVAVMGAVGVDLVARRGLSRLDVTAKPNAFRALLRIGALILVGVALPLLYLALLLTQESETMFLRASVSALAIALAACFWLATWALVEGRETRWWFGKSFAVLITALLYFDLAATGAYTDVSEQDPTIGFHHDEIVAFLRAQAGTPFRIDTMTGIEQHWQPDTAALYGLQDVGGIANPLSLRHWSDLLDATGGRSTLLYDMLNAEYVIVEDGTPLPDGKFELALDAAGPLSVYRNEDVLPRAWIVHEATAEADLAASLEGMQAVDFDPASEAIVAGSDLPSLSGALGSDLVTLTDYSANRLALDVGADGDGLMVLSEMWYPGWRATVNGTETPVLAVNGGLRGVAVPSGASTVELWFAPRTWRVGIALAALGLGLLIVWSIYGLARGRRREA